MTWRERGGVLVLDKPSAMTSHDVVNRVRRLYGVRRVGHAGTLDPLATGVLVLCIGQATRILEYLSAGRKRYMAGVLFGLRTDSQDITGTEIDRAETSHLTRDELEACLPGFRGRILQTPPMHSAVHHQGKRLYELARQGIEVDRAAREIEIFDLSLLEFVPGPSARAVLDVTCSSGTYIRTLASDIGDTMGTGAVMDSLRRTEVGPFTLTDARELCELERTEEESLSATLLPVSDALRDWPRIVLAESQVEEIRHGRPLADSGFQETRPLLLLDQAGDPVALARARHGQIAPFKVFRSDD